MRVTLRTVSVLTVLCILAGIVLLDLTGSTGGDISPFNFYGLGMIALGVLLAFPTAILGIIASAQGRQYVWLIAMIVVVLIPLIGVPTVEELAGQVDQNTANFLTGTVFGALILGGPILLALVIFVYSFFIREPAAVAMPPRTTAPYR